MKTFLFINIFLFFTSSLHSQENATFTRQQMIQDFDYMFECLQKVSPRFEVRRLITGCDVLGDIEQLRPLFDTIPSDGDFYKILKKALNLCKDMHISFASTYPYNDVDSILVTQCKERLDNLKKYDPPYRTIEMFYRDGTYFVSDIFNEDSILQIPAESQLLEINGMPIDTYVSTWVAPHTSRVLWDSEYQKYYVKSLISPRSLDINSDFTIKYYSDGESKEVNLSPFSYTLNPKNKNHRDYKVDYYDRDNLLYVRLPSMRTNMISFYKEEISKYKEQDIKKVIIDVRGNGGGNDWVWSEVLSAIVKDTLSIVQRLAFKDNDLARYCLQRDGIDVVKNRPNYKPLVIGKDSLFYWTINRHVIPSENSLNYTGQIYILTDDRCFSSTLALIAFAQGVDQLVTVGTPLGFFGGQGIRPFYFILPNSGLVFSVDGSLDVSTMDQGDLETYFNNTLDITLSPTIKEVLKVWEYEGDFYGNNLYEIDPLFKKVVLLP